MCLAYNINNNLAVWSTMANTTCHSIINGNKHIITKNLSKDTFEESILCSCKLNILLKIILVYTNFYANIPRIIEAVTNESWLEVLIKLENKVFPRILEVWHDRSLLVISHPSLEKISLPSAQSWVMLYTKINISNQVPRDSACV